jgi:hypothetical protein
MKLIRYGCLKPVHRQMSTDQKSVLSFPVSRTLNDLTT